MGINTPFLSECRVIAAEKTFAITRHSILPPFPVKREGRISSYTG
jgi:hypothetical protein